MEIREHATQPANAQHSAKPSTPSARVIDTRQSPHSTLHPADLTAVRWAPGSFWGERFQQCAEVTLPHLYRLMDDPDTGHALTNLRIAAGLQDGAFAGTHYQDEWVYKWLEAAAYIFEVTRDERLDRQMDEIIGIIAKAQQPDGYIATQITLRGWPRFKEIRHHELYVMGHLITAACIHHRVTGKTPLLDVARRAANYLYDTFMPRDPDLAHFGFNPSYIMALIELYRTVHDRRYLDLANVFIEMRGSQSGGSDQNQNHVPLREEQEVVGHMVLATYLYAGAADAFMETGDRTLLKALDRLWHDLTERKMYVHGGVCPQHHGLSIRGDQVHEAADAAYNLPNSTAYNETCAQIGNMMWNWRMLAINGQPAHADVMELSLYNSILSGIGLDGASWFYTNVLRWYGNDHVLLSNDFHHRIQPGNPPKRAQICCPSNLLRTTAGLHGYVYSLSDAGIWVNLYGASTFDGDLPNGTQVKLTQQTEYPWDGRIRITVEDVSASHFAIHLRIPDWATNATIKMNGTSVGEQLVPQSYVVLDRDWSIGDTIDLTLPMNVRLLEAHPRVEAVRNQVAVQRGPIVYCLESPDLPDGVDVSNVVVPRDITLTPRHDPTLLGGVTVLEGDVLIDQSEDWAGQLYRDMRNVPRKRVRATLIPYYAWNNRGESKMSIWLPVSG